MKLKGLEDVIGLTVSLSLSLSLSLSQSFHFIVLIREGL
jgi:hypothetical protein